jgi:predicted PurR-regulated permease PerM
MLRIVWTPGKQTPPAAPRRRSDLHRGYVWALGVLGAIATAVALAGLRGLLVSIFLAVFATVGLDPLVRLFQRRGLSRAWALTIVVALIAVLLVAVIWIVIPLVVRQVSVLAVTIPQEIEQLKASDWFAQMDQRSNGVLDAFFGWLSDALTDPAVWAAIANGLVGVGLTLASGLSSAFFMVILVLYFLGSYGSTKAAVYRLVSASHRAAFVGYSERILENVGKYLSAGVTLAFFNSVFSFMLLLVAGVPGAFVIGLAAFFITLIPLIGTVITTVAMTIIALIHSPTSAIIVLIGMLIYMQIEAYVFSPRLMGKAVKVPGSLVFISATAGGALFGLTGALVAIPISAGAVLIIREVVMPQKDRQ